MNKNIMALVLTILTAFGAPTVIEEVTNDTPAPAIVLDGPDKCEVGELVHLTYPARKVEWLLPGVDYHIDGQKAFISFRTPGVYQVVVSGLVDNDVRLLTHDIKVEGTVSVLDVTPVPDNVPSPTPDVGPKYDLAKDVAAWCKEAEIPSDVATSLGNNFIDAASTTDTVPNLMRVVAEKNRETKQDGAEEVLTKIQVWMIENLTGHDFADHQCAFSEIGDGFLSYAASN